MSATTRWILQASAAAALLVFTASVCRAQLMLPQRANQPFGDRAKAGTPGRLPLIVSTPTVRGPSVIGMPSINGSYLQNATDPTSASRLSPQPDLSGGNSFARGPVLANPFAFAPSWDGTSVPNPQAANRMVRNPLVVNQLLVNPLLGNRLADPLNGPVVLAGGWGMPILPARADASPLADARRPGSLLDQTPDFSTSTITTAAYQPASGIVTLADGSTFYRGTGAGTELGNSSTGGGLDSGLLSGSFFSPGLGSVGTLGQSAFLPYVW